MRFDNNMLVEAFTLYLRDLPAEVQNSVYSGKFSELFDEMDAECEDFV